MDRDLIVRRLETDLVGPLSEDECLRDAKPSDVYLTGILWPRDVRLDAEEDDRLDSAGTASGGEDDTEGAGEEVPLSGLQRPCTAGLSFAVETEAVVTLDVKLQFALYDLVEGDTAKHGMEPHGAAESGKSLEVGRDAGLSDSGSVTAPKGGSNRNWQRHPFAKTFEKLLVKDHANERVPIRCDGLPAGVSIYLRSTPIGRLRLVTLTVVNEMKPVEKNSVEVEQKTMFQVGLSVQPAEQCTLVPKPDNLLSGDEEESSAALLYRDCRAFAAGHTCAAEWFAAPDGCSALRVGTTWLPRYEVPKVQSGGHEVFDRLRSDDSVRCLEAEWIGKAYPNALGVGLRRLVESYSEWISDEYKRIGGLPQHHQPAAWDNLKKCDGIRDRMARGVDRIAQDERLRTAFQLANRAIQLQHEWNPERKDSGPLLWRPFQLAFSLLAAASVCDDSDPDREVMDLLWFPTGGGKTEAYLALIATLAFYRRLAHGADNRTGVAAVMRYTLRLLTTQQFVRASALILACEAIRRSTVRSSGWCSRLGTRPFSIGLWVGGEATPNHFEDAAKALAGDRKEASPEQLTNCPCCQQRLRWTANAPLSRIEARCMNAACELGGDDDEPLPIWTVDDDVYREKPTLLIGTIDKFAQLPRRKEIHSLFGIGSEDSPDLIIQDELHLISGPLGTIAAVYETAFDWLIARGGRRAKIIGSTATIRRAVDQTRALFNRTAAQFPPAGLDHYNSGFAVLDTKNPGRLYVGVTTAGRSAKFTLQAAAGCVLQSAFGEIGSLERRDPYATLVAYFNSLRELGGALVLMQDDVTDSIKLYGDRHAEKLRSAGNIEELTSRRTQEEVRDMLGKLATRATDEGCVDVVLATNMVSVGVDIPRLGLMLINGQPKARSEYVQATSRVGRDKAPGLVLSVLNSAKPRDRSHYETFNIWHQSLYRDVEATSVTPFASRARDRAMHAALASMIRHGVASMLDGPRMSDAQRDLAQVVVDEIVARAAEIDPSETRVRRDVERKLADWEARQPGTYWNDRQSKRSLMQSAERAAALAALGRGYGDAWPTMNNMRSVEPAVRFRLAERLRSRDDQDDEGDAAK